MTELRAALDSRGVRQAELIKALDKHASTMTQRMPSRPPARAPSPTAPAQGAQGDDAAEAAEEDDAVRRSSRRTQQRSQHSGTAEEEASEFVSEADLRYENALKEEWLAALPLGSEGKHNTRGTSRVRRNTRTSQRTRGTFSVNAFDPGTYHDNMLVSLREEVLDKESCVVDRMALLGSPWCAQDSAKLREQWVRPLRRRARAPVRPR